MSYDECSKTKNSRIIRTKRNLPKSIEDSEGVKEQSKTQPIRALKWSPAYDKCQEMKILASLEALDYSQNNKTVLNIKFDEIVRGHVRFICGQPQGQSLIGANLISNGMFHSLWVKILKEQTCINFERMRVDYYSNYKHAILQNYQLFQQAFKKQKIPNQEIMQDESQEQKQQMEESLDEESCIYRRLEKECPEDSSEDQVMVLGKEEDNRFMLPFDEDDDKNSQNGTIIGEEEEEQTMENQLFTSSLIFDEQTNERRIAAELVCMFFRIPQSRIIPIRSLKIVKILERSIENKFQILVVKGIELDKEQDSSQNEKLAISAYKFHSFEQLARIEITYGKIEFFLKFQPELSLSEYLRQSLSSLM